MRNQKIKGIILFILGIFLVIGYIYFASIGSPPTLSWKGIVLDSLYLAWMLSILVVSICMLKDKKLRFFEKLSLFSFALFFTIWIFFSIGENDPETRYTADLGFAILCFFYFLTNIAAVFFVVFDLWPDNGKEECPCLNSR